jgi:hypothetical protein
VGRATFHEQNERTATSDENVTDEGIGTRSRGLLSVQTNSSLFRHGVVQSSRSSSPRAIGKVKNELAKCRTPDKRSRVFYVLIRWLQILWPTQERRAAWEGYHKAS